MNAQTIVNKLLEDDAKEFIMAHGRLPERERVSSINPGDDFTAPHRVVLHKGHSGDWVTHFQNMQDKGFSYGNYFGDDYATAEKDYLKRCVKYKVDPDPKA